MSKIIIVTSDDVVKDENEDTNQMIECTIHGFFPAALKKYGCPDCEQERLDDEEEYNWRQARKKFEG